MSPRPRSRYLTHAFLMLAAMGAAAPIAGVTFVALEPPNATVSGVSLPSHLGTTNLTEVWNQGDFGAALAWSAVISVTTCAITVLAAVPAGYAFARMRFRGRSMLFYCFVFGLLLPYSAVLIPAYYEMRFLGLGGSSWSVTLPSAALSVAFGVFWMRAVFLGIPGELFEAATVDGARNWAVLAKVALPLVRSAVGVLVLLTFLWTWNSFLVPLVMLAGSNIPFATVTMASFQGGHVNDIPGLAAAALFVSAPVVAVYVATQRHFVRGVTEGGLKM
jgi:raffinose/stachyose/melibiose transport system permease protein